MSSSSAPVSIRVQEEWAQHVQKSLSSGVKGGPSVVVLASIADRHGLSWEQAREPAAGLCSRPEIQEAWADWAPVTDREELKLRLELLRFVDPLEPVLEDFLTFFFRASDPILYQSAAQALGVHLSDQSALRESLHSFAERQSVSLDEPVSLNNERSRRRLLIAQAAHVARVGVGDAQVPLRLEEPTSYLQSSSADLNAVLVATTALLESMDPPSSWQQFGYQLVEGVADHPQTTRADPGLLRSWSRVVALLNQEDAHRTCTVWWTLFNRFLEARKGLMDRGFAERMRHLAQMDEVVRGAVSLDASLQHELLQRLGSHSSGEHRLFLLYRWWMWIRREKHAGELEIQSQLRTHLKEGGELVGRLVRAELGSPSDQSVGGPEALGDRRLSVLGELVRAMGQKSKWLSRPVHDRALMAFSALDLSRHQEGSSGALEALFEQYGFPPLRAESSDTRPRMRFRGTAGPTTYRIMLRLSEWESFGAEHFIGTRMIHQITDPYVLLMLLPSRLESERAAVLADAVEHQLRLRLTTDPDFHPEPFLYETSVRAPHPQFYEHLKQICRNRTYERPNGRSVPVLPLVERLWTEGQRIRSQSGEWEMQDGWIQEWPGDSRFSAGLRYVRTELFEILQEPTLIDGLEQFIDLLDPKTTDPSSGSKGLLGLVEGGTRSSTPLVRRGQMRDGARTSRDVSEAVLEQVIDLREALLELYPSTLDQAVAIRDDVVEIHEGLEVVEREIVPVVGVVEGQLLQHVLEELRARLHTWTDSLSAVHGEWQAGREEETPVPTLAEDLFERVFEYDPGPPRTALLKIVATTLIESAREPSAPSAPTPRSVSDSWSRERDLLAWAVSPPQTDRFSPSERETWMQPFTDSWVYLTKTAMEAGYESRVRRMVEEDTFSAVRSRPSTTETLTAARGWHLDRYHFPAAQRVTQVLNRSSGSHTSVGSTTTAFFTNFSRVWLALLLGAILMLDFGSAWTAMAAEGDVLRVAVTFIVGVTGTFGYLFVDLRQKVRLSPGDSLWTARFSRLGRLLAFLLVCLGVTFVLTLLLWSLLAGTGEVVEGPGAVLHIVVWTGFALFVGVFFGLIAEAA